MKNDNKSDELKLIISTAAMTYRNKFIGAGSDESNFQGSTGVSGIKLARFYRSVMSFIMTWLIRDPHFGNFVKIVEFQSHN